MFAVTIPAVVQERTDAINAFRRSIALTKGYRWQVLGILFLIQVLNRATAWAIEKLLPPISPLVDSLIALRCFFGFIGIQATAMALVYYRLRIGKEGVDIDDLASVFD
jgi:hypothetical protein